MIPFRSLSLVCYWFASGLVCAETTTVLNGVSPNKRWELKVEGSSHAFGNPSRLILLSISNGQVASSVELGGYASFPRSAEPVNLSVLWSATSKHLAVSIRDTKRSWSASLYSVSQNALKLIDLPSATEQAYLLIGAKECFRCVREEPSKWTDGDTLIIRARGDTTIKDKVMWYEVDVTYKVSTRKVISTKLVSLEPHEG